MKAWPIQRRSLLDVLRLVGDSPLRVRQSSRDLMLWKDLTAIAAEVRPDDPAALSKVRLPMLKRILAAEWGEPALRDEVALAMLRAVDRLVAVDPEMGEILRRAIMALHREG